MLTSQSTINTGAPAELPAAEPTALNLADFGLTATDGQLVEVQAEPAPPGARPSHEDGGEGEGEGADSKTVGKGKEPDAAKPADKAKPADDTAAKPTAKPADTTPAKPTGKRVYDGIKDNAQREALSRMSNDAYALVYPILKDLAAGELIKKSEAAALMPAPMNYLDHEHGYALTEEYNDLSQELSLLDTERAHWVEQLAAIEDEKPIYGLVHNKDGSLSRTTQTYQPNAKARAFVQDQLMTINSSKQKASADREALRDKHRAASVAYNKTINDYDANVFGAFNTNKRFIKDVTAYLDQFPSHIRNKPEAKVVAKYHVMHDALLKELASAKAELAKLTKATSATFAGGSPDPSTIGGEPGGTEDDDSAALAAFDAIEAKARRR